MRLSISALLTLALLAAVPALAAGKSSAKKKSVAKVSACDGLVEKRLELAAEIQAIDAGIAEKRQKMAALQATDAHTVDMTATEEVDLTATDDGTRAHHDTLKSVQALQSEIATLDESRLAAERRAAKVKSTITQSCPKKP